MQAVTPVDVHIENEWHEGSNVQKKTRTSSRTDRQAPRMRTRVSNKTKTKKSSHIPKQVAVPKLVSPIRSQSSSPNRGPWVPPPGRSTKGQKISWQSPKSRLEINPVTEFIIDDEGSLNSEYDKQNTTMNSPTNTLSTDENRKLMSEIQIYEKRIQGLIDGIGMLKDRMHHHADREKTDQLRSDIDSSLLELEQLQQNHTQRVSDRTSRISRSLSPSPIRTNNNRSLSADEQRQRRSTTPKVSFQDDPIIEKQKARSTTPVQGPIHLNPDREQLLISLVQSESDIAQITKQLSSVKDILAKLKLMRKASALEQFDDQAVSSEVEQLYQQRNELLHLIEQFERSNSKLQEFLRHQYHLEAEDGIISDKYDTLKIHIDILEQENQQLRRVLLDRENDNIALQTELELIRTHSIGFDTMKTSLEQNRAHLQRELYAKEGEINRLQCALRSLEHDLKRSRYQFNNNYRSTKRTPMFSTPTSSSSLHVVPKTKAITIERLQAELDDRDHQINELRKQLYDKKTEQPADTNSEIVYLRTKLEQAEHLANEYKAQLHTQTLKTSANNSRNHLSEIELEKIRARLQKRIEELEPLPELLKQAELKNKKLQQHNDELQKRLSEQSTYPTQTSLADRIQENHFSSDDDPRTLQRKIISLEEQNEKLLKTLHAKEEELRTAQSRLNTKTYDLTSMNKQMDVKRTDLKIRDDTIGSKQRFLQTSTFDLEQQISRLRLEYAQSKREKDELERRFTLELSELRDQLKHTNNSNRSMQNYINSLKTTYATLFNDTLPTSLTRYTTT